MSSTLTLQNSINFAAPILKNQPLLISNSEPALTAGNLVLQTLLAPPFRWRFNRNSTNFPITTANGTDYSQTVGDFGFLDTMWLKDATGNIFQLGGDTTLAVDPNKMRPTKVAPQYDDNVGDITFRFDHTPDQNYTAYIDYQKKAALMASAASPWGIVPDEFSFVYNWGFLSLMSLLINDSRFPIFDNFFMSRLLSVQDGLTDQQRNIFVGNWTALVATMSRTSGSVQSGIAGRTK